MGPSLLLNKIGYLTIPHDIFLHTNSLLHFTCRSLNFEYNIVSIPGGHETDYLKGLHIAKSGISTFQVLTISLFYFILFRTMKFTQFNGEVRRYVWYSRDFGRLGDIGSNSKPG